MTVLDTAPPSLPLASAYGSARLLAGVTGGRRADLARHREAHGQVRFCDHPTLVDAAHRVGLLGRGGASFPVAVKLAAVPCGSATEVLVNGAEGEPASHKDRTLLQLAPHLVLDGALGVAAALGTTRVTIMVHDDAASASVTAAAKERRDAGRVRVVTGSGGFVSGEVRAVIRAVDGDVAVPPGRRVLPHLSGVGGHPTFASNVETFAQLALLVSLGVNGFASVGSTAEPGTTLLTLLGDVTRPGVVEVPTGLPLSALLPDRGDAGPEGAGPVLVGGYHGSWVASVDDLAVERPALRAAGVPLNAGVIARLSPATCPLAEVAAVSAWLAAQSSGQCGPCFFGVPSVAADVGALWRGEDADRRIERRLAHLPGRGACAHPDGSAAFVRTALATLRPEVERHRRHGSCGRDWLQELPTGLPTHTTVRRVR